MFVHPAPHTHHASPPLPPLTPCVCARVFACSTTPPPLTSTTTQRRWPTGWGACRQGGGGGAGWLGREGGFTWWVGGWISERVGSSCSKSRGGRFSVAHDQQWPHGCPTPPSPPSACPPCAQAQIPTVVEKAAASEGNSTGERETAGVKWGGGDWQRIRRAFFAKGGGCVWGWGAGGASPCTTHSASAPADHLPHPL